MLSEPEIFERELDAGRDVLLVLGSDGLWDEVGDAEACAVAAAAARASAARPDAAACGGVTALLEHANAAWLRHGDEMDDMSVVVALFKGFEAP